jgi:hypothetical protein
MAAESSHGIVRVASTIATIVETQIGANVELPTRANGWMINHITGYVARITATAAESTGGHIRLNSPSGDLTPDPQPSRWPIYADASFLGATAPVGNCPLHRYPTELAAAGKADLEFFATNAIADTAAPIYGMGIHFAPEIIIPKRPFFSNIVRAAQALAARTQVGTITLSEKATEIVRIVGFLSQNGVLTTAEECIGFFDLASEDVELVPSQWLFNDVAGAGVGATIGGHIHFPPDPHDVSIPVPNGARIDCFVTLATALTNAADVMICLQYR